MTIETEIGVTQPQIRNADHLQIGRARNGLSPRASGGNAAMTSRPQPRESDFGFLTSVTE